MMDSLAKQLCFHKWNIIFHMCLYVNCYFNVIFYILHVTYPKIPCVCIMWILSNPKCPKPAVPICTFFTWEISVSHTCLYVNLCLIQFVTFHVKYLKISMSVSRMWIFHIWNMTHIWYLWNRFHEFLHTAFSHVISCISHIWKCLYHMNLSHM